MAEARWERESGYDAFEFTNETDLPPARHRIRLGNPNDLPPERDSNAGPTTTYITAVEYLF